MRLTVFVPCRTLPGSVTAIQTLTSRMMCMTKTTSAGEMGQVYQVWSWSASCMGQVYQVVLILRAYYFYKCKCKPFLCWVVYALHFAIIARLSFQCHCVCVCVLGAAVTR